MLDQSTKMVKKIFSDVLSSLAFMFTEEEDGGAAWPGPSWMECSIGYRGTVSGTLRMRCTRRFATQLAANLLGIDDSDENADSSAEDAVKEFMNIVCGQFVTAMFGTEEVFDLTIPEVEERAAMPDTAKGSDVEYAKMMVEGEPVQLAHFAPEEPARVLDEIL